jgi:hypothetical protein
VRDCPIRSSPASLLLSPRNRMPLLLAQHVFLEAEADDAPLFLEYRRHTVSTTAQAFLGAY